MNIETAFIKLNLDKNRDIYDIKKLKKHYHFLALKYHPDKNDNYDSIKQFQEINESYNILLNFYENINDISNNSNDISNNINDISNNNSNINNNKKKKFVNNNIISFDELLYDFIDLLNIKNNEEIEIIKKYFVKKYKYYNTLILEKLSDTNYFKNLINIFNNINKNYDKLLIINTKLENILNNEVYKLELFDDEILYIPLWYKEVIYKEYLIKIKITNLDDKIKIDLDNNIYINIQRNVNDILDNDIRFNIENKEFIINNNLLYMKKNCNYKLNNCGIINPYCDVSDIINLNEESNYKSHIFVNLTLV